MMLPRPPRRKIDWFTAVAVSFTLINIIFFGIWILRHPYPTTADLVEALLRTLFVIIITWIPWFWFRKRYGNEE